MAGLSLDNRSSNSAFLSAGIFSADSIADLVFSMCSSVIYTSLLRLSSPPSYVYHLAFRFADTLQWDALRNNLRFQKSSPAPRCWRWRALTPLKSTNEKKGLRAGRLQNLAARARSEDERPAYLGKRAPARF